MDEKKKMILAAIGVVVAIAAAIFVGGDLVQAVILVARRLRPGFLDKVASKFGAVALDPGLIPGLCEAGAIKSYFITRRVRLRGASPEYCFNDDVSNVTYAMWLNARATPEQRATLREVIGSKVEVWADQVEATLGLCYLCERVTTIRDCFEGDVEMFRTRLEMDLRSAILPVPGLVSTKRSSHQKGVLSDEAKARYDEMTTDPNYEYSDEEPLVDFAKPTAAEARAAAEQPASSAAAPPPARRATGIRPTS
jgi:hypothetical protein